MNIVIGKERNEALMKKLGQDTQVYAPGQLPSLTAFLLDDPKIRHLIFLPDAQTGWSMGHILAAAQLLEHKGCIIFLFPQNQDLPRLIRRAQTLEDLDTLLKPGSTDTSSSGVRPAREPEPAPKPPEPIRPMQIPAGAVLILSVAGSQQRIGCTTQAVGLWHYCKALGFTPAVVADTASVSRIAGLMKCRSIPDGYMVGQIPFVTGLWHYCKALGFTPAVVADTASVSRIAGLMKCRSIPDGYMVGQIPFVTSTAQAYDCYIQDMGVGWNGDPASRIAGLMKCRSIPDGYMVGQIPFVTSTAQAYDCYIQDMGVGWNGDPAAACKGSDAVVLVCGTKSWELQDTCYALDRLAAVAPGISILASFATEADVGSLQGVLVLVCGTKSWELQDTCYALDRLAAVAPGISILASFATEADVGSLQGVFGDHPAGAAPWMPSFWEASGAALELYDRLLRPVSFATEADVGSLQGVFGDHPAGAAPWMPSFWEASGAALELYDRLLRPVLMELLRSGRAQDLEPEISMEEIEITEEIGGNTNV